LFSFCSEILINEIILCIPMALTVLLFSAIIVNMSMTRAIIVNMSMTLCFCAKPGVPQKDVK